MRLTFLSLRKLGTQLLFAAGVLLLGVHSLEGQVRAQAFRAAHYEVEATLLPAEQRLTGKARVEFEATSPSGVIEAELHPNLRISAVTGADGKPVPHERSTESPLVVRVMLPQQVATGQRVALTFEYAGLLANAENSPVRGVQLAHVGPDGSFLLLPARWFPLTGYPSNRYTGVFHITVPDETVVAGTGRGEGPTVKTGVATAPRVRTGVPPPPPPKFLVYTFRTERPAAAGSFVAGALQAVPVQAEGLRVAVYAPQSDRPTAQEYGETAARAVQFFSEQFGALPQPNLTVAQMPEISVHGFAGPGLVLINKRQWTEKANYRLVARLVANQWWGEEVAPASTNDVWLADGLAHYSQALFQNHLAGEESFRLAISDFTVGALMYEDAAPIAQAGRLDPFTPEYRSVVMNKGAMVFHMLRSQIGEDAFERLLQDFYTRYAGKSATIRDLQDLAQQVAPASAGDGSSTRNLTPFFIQWLNSTGIPQFQLEYVVYRTQQGFRTVGKVRQNLETFRMQVEVRVETEGNPELKTIQVVGTESDFALETFGRPKPGGIRLDPNHQLLTASTSLRARAIISRGEELAEMGRFYDAMQEYQRALELQKNNSLALFRMGEAAFFQKNYQSAANAFRDAILGEREAAYNWVEVWSYIYLGKIYDISGQRERALNEYRKALDTRDDTGGAQAEASKYLSEPYREDAARPAA